MKILIAVDGSIYTDHALEFLASREGFLASSPEIEMLSVVPQIPAGALRFIERETLEGYYKDCSEKIFKPIRKFLKGKDLPVEEVYVVGDPSEGIADEVDRTKPDLVVMGSPEPQGAFPRLRHARCARSHQGADVDCSLRPDSEKGQHACRHRR